jgi:Ca-activated chloride channel family protein
MKNLSLNTAKSMLWKLVVSVTLATATLSMAAGHALATSDLQQVLNQVESGTLVVSPQVSDGRYIAQYPLSTDVDIEVSGLLARAEVRQTFRNDNDYWIEAVYAFPLPDEARVDRMEMYIGDRVVRGVIREKAKARQEYAQALSEGKRASLLESHRANLFTNRVANIPPQEMIKVTFSYQWQIDYDDGVFGLRVPLTITPRYFPGQRLQAAQAKAQSGEDKQHSSALSGSADWTGSVVPSVSSASVNEAHQHQDDYLAHYPADSQARMSDAAALSPQLTTSASATPASIFITIDTSLPLESVHSESHDIVSDQTDTRWHVTLANPMVPKDRDFTLQWSPQLGHSPLAAAFTQSLSAENMSKKSEHFASVMVIPPQDLYQQPPAAREVIFVIDTSGSMQGNSIRQARAALQYAIQRLSETDTFNVIEFNNSARSLFANARIASTSARNNAVDWVGSLRADGGTEIALALDASLGKQSSTDNSADRLRQVVFITDGSVGNEAELFQQIENTLGHSRLFTIGIGSAPNTWFMRRAAETGRGTYTYIAKQNQVQQQMAQLLQKLERPVLTGITLSWSGIDQPEVYPAVIPDLYAGEPVLFDMRWLGDSTDKTTGTLLIQGLHQGRNWSKKLQIEAQADSKDTNSATSLEKQWAHRKIESMENSLLFSDDHETIEQRITDLALRYSMVTRYTSLVAVDQQVVRDPNNQSLKTAAIPSAIPHGNTMMLPQGSLGIGLRLLLASLFSLGAVLFGLATLHHTKTGHLETRQSQTSQRRTKQRRTSQTTAVRV